MAERATDSGGKAVGAAAEIRREDSLSQIRATRNAISIAIVACNEAANIGRTLASVIDFADEIILIDSGSSDGTPEIARSFGEKVRLFEEPWKGFACQKNSAIDKATGDWVLLLDADEAVSPELVVELRTLLAGNPEFSAYMIPRLNQIFGRWMRHGGFYPDHKLRLFRKGAARIPEDVDVHETPKTNEPTGTLKHDLLHYQYPTLAQYIEHMDRYSSASVAAAVGKGRTSRSLGAFLVNVVVNPATTFVKNYIFRGGFLDGREGLLLHLYHSVYVSWKYAKAWEKGRE
jgi:glycosyltransferase involved in cell wall biosynthesis